jgi:hypothetical protein
MVTPQTESARGQALISARHNRDRTPISSHVSSHAPILPQLHRPAGSQITGLAPPSLAGRLRARLSLQRNYFPRIITAQRNAIPIFGLPAPFGPRSPSTLPVRAARSTPA